MKILHTGDIHLGELAGPVCQGENIRMKTTLKTMDEIYQNSIKQNIDLIIIAGDIFDNARLWTNDTMKQFKIIVQWLKNLVNVAPTVILLGTNNHDNLNTFNMLDNLNINNLTVISQPELTIINSKSGQVQIAAIPAIDKNAFRSKFEGMSVDEENKFCTNEIHTIILGLSAQLNKNIPSVLIGHYTVIGSKINNTNISSKINEIVISQASLLATDFTLCCFAHIHNPQKILEKPATFYCGSPNRITFNEEDNDKGFWIHHIDNNKYINSKFIDTSADKMYTLYLDKINMHKWLNKKVQLKEISSIEFFNKIVRVFYEIDSCDSPLFNKSLMEKELYDNGALYVSGIIRKQNIGPTEIVDFKKIETPEIMLKDYFTSRKVPENELEQLMSIAKPIIDNTLSDIFISGSKGVFEPISLKVKNYRSYKEQYFNFRKVKFCTVNGNNGAGKSSFFMDAIVDCLYEETREGDLISWINNSNEVKSGSIEFVFNISTRCFRVVRTRTKSNKGNLNLSELIENEWIDISYTKMNDTQTKIKKLIGMDFNTFTSCVLIMQDKYGLFFEISRDSRIEILSNLLGLDVYTALERNISECIKKVNTEVSKLQEKVKEISYNLNSSGDVLSQQEEIEKQIKMYTSKIEELNNILTKELEKKTNYYNLISQLEKLSLDMQRNQGELEKKREQYNNIEHKIRRAQKIISNKEKIEEKVLHYNKQSELEIQLKSKLNEMEKTQLIIKKLEIDLSNSKDNLNNLKGEKLKLEDKILNFSKYINSGNKLLQAKDRLIKMQNDFETKQQSIHNRMLLQSRKTELINKYETDINNLTVSYENLYSKTKILDKVKCNDINNAKCEFLIDAKKALECLPNEKKKLEDLQNKFKSEVVQGEIDSLDREILDCENIIASIEPITKEQLTVQDNTVKKLSQETFLYSQIKNLEGMLATVNVQINGVEQNINTINQDIEEYKKQLKEIDVIQENIIEIENNKAEAEKWLKSKEELTISENTLKDNQSTLCALTYDLENFNNSINNLKREIENIETQIKENEISEHQINLHQTNLSLFQKTKEEKLITLGFINQKSSIYSKNKAEYDKLTKELKELAFNKELLNKILSAFSQDGIPFIIIQDVVPEIEKEANDILSKMTKGEMSLSIKTSKQQRNKKEINVIDIFTVDSENKVLSYTSKSGGQKVKIALALAFALSQIKSKMIGIKIGMLFIDEPPYLDASGTQAYATGLESISENSKFTKILAITHDESMKDRFPQNIDIVFENGKSTIISNKL